MRLSGSAAVRSRLVVISLCFFLSGFAALLYQAAWQREFSIVFGTSELAVATVLAVYMGGLALGAALAEGFVARILRPVLVYGLLEAGIAVTALCVPLALGWAGSLYAALLGNQPMPPDARGLGQSLFYVLAGFLILAVPTGLMGATLPVLMRSVVRTDAQVGPRAAMLYGINTAGAVAGAVLAGFVLLGALGLRGTVWVGVVVNMLVFAIAALVALGFPPAPPSPQPRLASADDPTFIAHCLKPLWRAQTRGRALNVQPSWILPAMAVSGGATFIYEVLWTRLLSHVVGSSVYAFATMLAAFLTGIALGGGLAGPFARRRAQAAGNFVVAQVAIAAISLGLFVFLDELLPATRGLTVNILLAGTVLLPPAVFIGATFPLAVRILSPDERLAARCTARVYAWNTVGAIAGALLAGFFLIPGLGFEGAVRVAVMLNLALALAAALLVRERSLPLAAGLLAGLLGVALFVQPSPPAAALRSSYVEAGAAESGTDLYFGVGRSSTVRLTEDATGFRIRNNGLSEAHILARGAPPRFEPWQWFGALPAAARPGAESMLVIGLGGGVAIERLPPGLREVHVVELEEKVVTANRLVGAIRNHDPLTDPRVTVIINDARNALRLTGRRYDVIVSQPSHPWTAGASHLFTAEFARLVKSRLMPDGVFVQWTSVGFLDQAMLRSLTATLTGVFGHVRLYNPQAVELLFVASDAPLDVERTLAGAAGVPGLAAHLASVGIASREDLLAALVLDEAAAVNLAARARPSTDDRNLMATHSRYLADGLSVRELYDITGDIQPLARPGFWNALETDVPGVDYAQLAAKLASRPGAVSRLPGLLRATTGQPGAELVEPVVMLTSGNRQQAQQRLRDILARRPQDPVARWLLVTTQLDNVLDGSAPRQLRDEAAALAGVPAAVLAALRHEQAGAWAEVAALDARLAGARSNEPWFLPALRLQAGWRLQPEHAGRQDLAAEALVRIDRIMPLRVDVPLLVQRATAAERLGDAPVALESVALALELLADVQTRPARARLKATLQALTGLLQTHPEWRAEPRGPTVFAALDRANSRFL